MHSNFQLAVLSLELVNNCLDQTNLEAEKLFFWPILFAACLCSPVTAFVIVPVLTSSVQYFAKVGSDDMWFALSFCNLFCDHYLFLVGYEQGLWGMNPVTSIDSSEWMKKELISVLVKKKWKGSKWLKEIES